MKIRSLFLTLFSAAAIMLTLSHCEQHEGPVDAAPEARAEPETVPEAEAPVEKKKIIFIAGPPSHAPGQHEHNAGSILLGGLLNEHYGDYVEAIVHENGWPEDTTSIQEADAIVMYSDGQKRHVGYYHRDQMHALRDKGVGIGAIHYAVEMEPGQTNDDLISWIGGAFEIHKSVNPHWDADFTSLPDHEVTNGVDPFLIRDEWYFNMRFANSGVTPILTAIAPEETMSRPDGHHSGNPEVRELVANKVPQHVCWLYDREDGGRGFGFTGGHFHQNWQDDRFRTTVLNAIAWIAGLEVPEDGVPSDTPTDEEMGMNLDDKPERKPRKPAPKKEDAEA